jgi:HD-like signal output (HDOD) protein
LSGSDPLTAVFESVQATTDTRRLPEGFSLDTVAFQDAENFWDKYIDQGDIAQSWTQYEKLNKKTTTALEEFPALPLLMQALQKSNEEGTTDDPTAT